MDLSKMKAAEYVDPKINKLYYVLKEGTTVKDHTVIYSNKEIIYNTICKYCGYKSVPKTAVNKTKCGIGKDGCGRKWNLKDNTIEGTVKSKSGGKFDPVDAAEYEKEHALPKPEEELYPVPEPDRVQTRSKHFSSSKMLDSTDDEEDSPPEDASEEDSVWIEGEDGEPDKRANDFTEADNDAIFGTKPIEGATKAPRVETMKRPKKEAITSSEPKIKQPKKSTKVEGVIEELSPDITLKELMSLIKDQKGDLTSTIKVKKGDILQFGEKLFIVK